MTKVDDEHQVQFEDSVDEALQQKGGETRNLDPELVSSPPLSKSTFRNWFWATLVALAIAMMFLVVLGNLRASKVSEVEAQPQETETEMSVNEIRKELTQANERALNYVLGELQAGLDVHHLL